jgi:hypothetical protein
MRFFQYSLQRLLHGRERGEDLAVVERRRDSDLLAERRPASALWLSRKRLQGEGVPLAVVVRQLVRRAAVVVGVVAVATTAVVLGRWSHEYRDLAAYHDYQVARLTTARNPAAFRNADEPSLRSERRTYHLRLREKYEQATYRPWRSVETDTDEPR